MKPLPAKTMSKSDQRVMREWAQEHGKDVRQLTIRQTNTKHAAGTLPLNMYRKELPVGERISSECAVLKNCGEEIEPSVSDDEDYQLVEDQERESVAEDSEVPVTPVNFFI